MYFSSLPRVLRRGVRVLVESSLRETKGIPKSKSKKQEKSEDCFICADSLESNSSSFYSLCNELQGNVVRILDIKVERAVDFSSQSQRSCKKYLRKVDCNTKKQNILKSLIDGVKSVYRQQHTQQNSNNKRPKSSSVHNVSNIRPAKKVKCQTQSSPCNVSNDS